MTSEREAHLQLNAARRLERVRHAEPGVLRLRPVGLTAPVDVRLTPSFSSPVTGSNAGCDIGERDPPAY